MSYQEVEQDNRIIATNKVSDYALISICLIDDQDLKNKITLMHEKDRLTYDHKRACVLLRDQDPSYVLQSYASGKAD